MSGKTKYPLLMIKRLVIEYESRNTQNQFCVTFMLTTIIRISLLENSKITTVFQ